MSTDEAELEALTETGHHVTGASGHEVHHGLTDLGYVKIAVALALITGLEVSLTYMDIGVLFLPLLIVLMVIKNENALWDVTQLRRHHYQVTLDNACQPRVKCVDNEDECGGGVGRPPGVERRRGRKQTYAGRNSGRTT